MPRRGKTRETVEFFRKHFGSYAAIQNRTGISWQRLRAIEQGKGKPPTPSEIRKISALNKRYQYEYLSVNDIARLTGSTPKNVRDRSKPHGLTGGILVKTNRLPDSNKPISPGTIIPVDENRKPVQAIGYIVRNRKTGESAFYWGDYNAFVRLSSQEFLARYDLKPDIYEVEIIHGEEAL